MGGRRFAQDRGFGCPCRQAGPWWRPLAGARHPESAPGQPLWGCPSPSAPLPAPPCSWKYSHMFRLQVDDCPCWHFMNSSTIQNAVQHLGATGQCRLWQARRAFLCCLGPRIEGNLALTHASAAALASACCSNSTKAVPFSFFVPLSCTSLTAATHPHSPSTQAHLKAHEGAQIL